MREEILWEADLAHDSNWRWFYDYSGGNLADFGAHLANVGPRLGRETRRRDPANEQVIGDDEA